MSSLYESEPLVTECLCPHTHPIERKLAESFYEILSYIVRVAFYCYLCISFHLIIYIGGIQYLLKLGNSQLRRCPSTQVDGLDRCVFTNHTDLFADRLNISLTEFQPCRRIEATIDAATPAKWNMNV